MGHFYPWGAGTPLEKPPRNFSVRGSLLSRSPRCVSAPDCCPVPPKHRTPRACSCPSGQKVTTPSGQSETGDREASCQCKGLEGDKCHSPKQLPPSSEHAKPFVGLWTIWMSSHLCQHNIKIAPSQKQHFDVCTRHSLFQAGIFPWPSASHWQS